MKNSQKIMNLDREVSHFLFSTFYFLFAFIIFNFILLTFNSPSAHASALTRPSNNLGLVGYWSFEDATSTKATDFSGKGNTGTLNGDASWGSGKRGKSILLDGTGDYMDAGSPANLEFGTGDFTFSMWINPSADATSDKTGLISTMGFAQSGYLFAYRSSSGNKLYVETYDGTFNPNGYNNTSIPANIWTHVALVRTGGNYAFYINGVSDGTTSDSAGNITNTNSVRIGSTVATPAASFPGKIDEVRIYNRALGATEIAALYNAGGIKANNRPATLTAGMVGYWPFDEGLGSTTADISNNHNNGTLAGSSAWTTGKYSNALTFDGGGYISTGGSTSDGSASTFAWINPSFLGTCPGGSPNSCEVVMIAGNFLLEVNSGMIEIYGYHFNTPQWVQVADAGIVTNRWMHVGFTYDQTTLRVYLNGVQIGTANVPGNMGSGGGITIGGDNNFRLFKGKIDDVRSYDRALSAAEVRKIYNGNVTTINASQNTIAPSNLVFWHTFDGAYLNTTTSTDRSGSGRNGALVGNVHPGIGKIGQAMIFDGTGDYVDAGSSPITGSNPFTLAAWVKTNSVNGYSGALAIGDTSYGLSAYIGTVGGAQVGSDNSLGGGFYGSNYGSGITKVGQWAHVALTFAGGSGGAAKIYVDGVEKVSTTASPNLGTGTLRIGRITTDTIYDFNGAIDDARVYNRELSAAEILKLYNQGK